MPDGAKMMSAYVVDRDHVRYLVTAATSRRLHPGHSGLCLRWRHNGTWEELHYSTPKREAEVGQMLWDECIASVLHRYSDCDRSEMPGPIGEDFAYSTHKPWHASIDPVQVLKACDCYEYQSCEHPGWPESSASAFIESLRTAAWQALPGYEDANWGAPQGCQAA